MAPSENGETPPRRVFLVSAPRTASNLLQKILALNEQANVVTNDKAGYFLIDVYFSAVMSGTLFKPIPAWTPEDMDRVQKTLQKSINDLEEYTALANSQGKLFVAKEHAQFMYRLSWIYQAANGKTDLEELPVDVHFPDSYGSLTFSAQNGTIFPDDYLKTWRMAFVIRHPALQVPSFVRVMRKSSRTQHMPADQFLTHLRLNTTLRWMRILYDWYQVNGYLSPYERDVNNHHPLLLDADDIINNPKIVEVFAKELGLDPTKLKLSWEAQEQETIDAQADDPQVLMRASLLGSTGIMKSKAAGNIDLAVEAEKWKEEFGPELGEKVEEWVRAAMPDYEYFKARRLVLKQ